VLSSNEAPTDFAASTVTTQLPVPLQAPDQPAKLDPVAGVAVRVTIEPCERVSLQSAPQSIPVPLTTPPPVPDVMTERVWSVGDVAVAVSDAVAVSEAAAVSDDVDVSDAVAVSDAEAVSDAVAVSDEVAVSDRVAVSVTVAMSDEVTVPDAVSLCVDDCVAVSVAGSPSDGSTQAACPTSNSAMRARVLLVIGHPVSADVSTSDAQRPCGIDKTGSEGNDASARISEGDVAV